MENRKATRLGGRRDEHVGRLHPAVPATAQASETLVDVLGALPGGGVDRHAGQAVEVSTESNEMTGAVRSSEHLEPDDVADPQLTLGELVERIKRGELTDLTLDEFLRMRRAQE